MLDSFDLSRRIRPGVMPTAQVPGPSYFELMRDRFLRPIATARYMDEYVETVNEVDLAIQRGRCLTLDSLYIELLHLAAIRPGVPFLAYPPFRSFVHDQKLTAIKAVSNLPVFEDGKALIEWAVQTWDTLTPTELEAGALATANDIDATWSQELFELQSEGMARIRSEGSAPMPEMFWGPTHFDKLLSAAMDLDGPEIDLPAANPEFSTKGLKTSGNLPSSRVGLVRNLPGPARRRNRRAFSDNSLTRPCTECPICRNPFKGPDWKSNLKKHMNSVHTKNRHFCRWETCDRHYNRTDNLLKHVRDRHTLLLTQFVCLWQSCGQSFQDYDVLLKHIQQHTSHAPRGRTC